MLKTVFKILGLFFLMVIARELTDISQTIDAWARFIGAIK